MICLWHLGSLTGQVSDCSGWAGWLRGQWALGLLQRQLLHVQVDAVPKHITHMRMQICIPIVISILIGMHMAPIQWMGERFQPTHPPRPHPATMQGTSVPLLDLLFWQMVKVACML